ncbi:pentatricopeptide repeat-containing protein at5g66520 [Phtheirospermum japonicum]|uniref:Pentatricopeptide repeat-containing protein at5g66520 n=1 Tax=Phtheirospermum japonicum TaxID=374723 RepID=A0A830AZU8_9LAMI|nr:pentatricopeptide repeat-containing protein at5g66520 [Phtheirospermum japonicum]
MEQKLALILSKCKTPKQLKQTHLQTLVNGLKDSNFLATKLMSLSSDLISLDYANKILQNSPTPNLICHNTLIKCSIGKSHKIATIAFNRSRQLGISSNSFTFTFLLRCFESFCKLESGETVHAHVMKIGFEYSNFVMNTLLNFYAKCGCDLRSACKLFDEMPERDIVSWNTMIQGYAMSGDIESAKIIFNQMPLKNVVSWNAMIAGCVNSHKFDEALRVFHHMLTDKKVKPDQTTLISTLSACTHLNSLEHGKWIESYIRRNNFELSLSLGNALIDMFAKCGDLENARKVFNKMSQRCIITWTTMISGLAVNGLCDEAIKLFHKMCYEGLIKPDDVIFIAVLSACAHGGLVEEGKILFHRMVNEFGIEPRIEHYGCVVDVLGRAGLIDEAIRFVETMRLEPNAVIWATLLSACRIHKNRDLSDFLVRKILELEPNNLSYLKLVTDLSSSGGQMGDALKFRVAARDERTEKVPGCSSIQVGDCVHEFVARDTRHRRIKEVYRALRSLNRHLKAINGVSVE